MSKTYCKLVPDKGADLFRKLSKLLGRTKAVELWEDVISHLDFLEDYKDTLTLDSEGIPTFESIIANPYIKLIIGKDNVKKSLEALFLTREDTRENFRLAVNDALVFNKLNKEFVAIVERNNDKLQIKLLDKNQANLAKFTELFGVTSLNDSITLILGNIGISPTVIKEAGVEGITDFSKAKTLANDLIRIADNISGEYALSEEFAHLCLEVFKDNPLVQRTKSTIGQEEAKQILGDLYETYAERYDNDESKLIDEAIGHLLLNSFFKVNNAPKKSQTLFGRLVSLIKNFFRKINSNDLRDALYTSKSAMDEVAKGILSSDLLLSREKISSIKRKDILYSLTLVLDAIGVLDKISDNEAKMAKIIKAEDTSFIEEIVSYLLNDADTALGICKYLEHTLNELTKLREDYQRYALADDLKVRFGTLRRIHNYINMYSTNLALISDLLSEARTSGLDELNLLSRLFDLHGITTATIRELVTLVKALSDDLIDDYLTVATKSLANFLKPFMGLKIVNPFKSGLQVASVEDLINEAKSDISWMDKWLSAMSESSDVLLQLFDLAAKKAKDKARLDTIRISEEIQRAWNKAKNAGVTDFSFMYLTINGKRTNSYIMGNSVDTLSPALREFYDKFMKLKTQLDEYLDDKKASPEHVILLRKDFSYGAIGLIAQGKFNEVGEYFMNKVFERDYDDLQGYNRRTLKGFDGKEYMLLPKYYLHDIDNQEEVSDDPVGSLIAYAFMANNYHEMDLIVDALETGRDILRRRSVKETRGEKLVKEAFDYAGIHVESEVEKEWSKTNIALKLDRFFNSLIYGRYLEDLGTWTVMGKQVSILKLTSTILGASSHIQLGFNWLANTANVANGIAMTNIEAAGGRYFKPRSLALADKIYTSLLADYVKELPELTKTNKLDLIQKYFDVRQDAHETAKHRYDKSLLTRIFGPNLAFIGQGAGDHWLYNRTAIAYMLETEAIDDKGNKSNLYEALEVVVLDGVGTLKIKDGWTIPKVGNKSPFSMIGRLIANINQKLFGIYNQDDAVAAQLVAVGRLAMQYRKWMMPAFAKRFQAALYNVTMDEWEEGYWRTFGREVLWNTLKDLRRGLFLLMAHWDKMSDEARANCMRAITETTLFGMVIAAIFLIGLAWPDKKNRPWLVKFLDYQMRRQKTELGALTPSPIMAHEFMKVINSPAAGLSAVDSGLSLFEAIFNPFAYFDERETGPYKGMNSVEKAIYVNTPYYKSVRRATSDIDTAMSYFNK